MILDRIALSLTRTGMALAMLLALLPSAGAAHPHEWIDLSVTLEFDSDKRLVAMKQSWLFDPYFSAYVVEELATNRPQRRRVREQAEAIAPDMVSNLSQHNYLNEWTYRGEPVTGLSGTFVAAEVRRKRMELTLRLTLSEPLDLSQGEFSYRVFDPTYYIEILHADGHRPRLKGGPRGCQTTITAPEPTQELLDYAADIDRDENPEDGLGQHFAERVTVECSDE